MAFWLSWKNTLLWEFVAFHNCSHKTSEVNQYGIAERYVATVVVRVMCELHGNSHQLTIQWVFVSSVEYLHMALKAMQLNN